MTHFSAEAGLFMRKQTWTRLQRENVGCNYKALFTWPRVSLHIKRHTFVVTQHFFDMTTALPAPLNPQTLENGM